MWLSRFRVFKLLGKWKDPLQFSSTSSIVLAFLDFGYVIVEFVHSRVYNRYLSSRFTYLKAYMQHISHFFDILYCPICFEFLCLSCCLIIFLASLWASKCTYLFIYFSYFYFLCIIFSYVSSFRLFFSSLVFSLKMFVANSHKILGGTWRGHFVFYDH